MMPAFLVAFFTKLAGTTGGQWLLTTVASWLATRIKSLYSKIKKSKELDSNAKDSVEPLKKAVSKEAIDRAARDAVDGI